MTVFQFQLEKRHQQTRKSKYENKLNQMKSLNVLGILLDFCHKKKIVCKTVM